MIYLIPVCECSESSVKVTVDTGNLYCSMTIDKRLLDHARTDLLTRTYEDILLAIAHEDSSIISPEHLRYLYGER